MDETDHDKIPSWYGEIFPAAPADGWYQKIGEHAASFVERDKQQLVVSFDNLSDAGYPYPDIEPWASKFVRENGWSHLGIYSRGPSWYRDRRLITLLERLSQDGFFQQFDNVALIGTSMGGFAALTFSSLCPGATVVALSPQSTLNEALVPWENRFRKGRARDWTLPFSDASEQLAQLGRAYLLYDPFFTRDKKHIMRMPQDRLIHLRGFGFGHKSAVVLRRMGLLKSFMKGAITNSLDTAEFYRAIRARKDLYIYRVNMENHLDLRGHPERIPGFRQAFRQRRRNQVAEPDDSAV